MLLSFGYQRSFIILFNFNFDICLHLHSSLYFVLTFLLLQHFNILYGSCSLGPCIFNRGNSSVGENYSVSTLIWTSLHLPSRSREDTCSPCNIAVSAACSFCSSSSLPHLFSHCIGAIFWTLKFQCLFGIMAVLSSFPSICLYPTPSCRATQAFWTLDIKKSLWKKLMGTFQALVFRTVFKHLVEPNFYLSVLISISYTFLLSTPPQHPQSE